MSQRRYSIKLLLIVAVALADQGCAGTESEELIVTRVSDQSSVEAIIGSTGVVVPLGFFALIRDRDRYCAVKFLEFGDSKAEPNKVPDIRYAVYEWHYQGDGSGDFGRSSASHGTGKATWKFIRFVGRFAFQRGNVGVDCGELQIAWYGRTGLTFAEARSEETENETIRRGLRIAPTSWTDVKQISVVEPQLMWFAYDAERTSRSIPVVK